MESVDFGLADALQRDAADPLAGWRDRFVIEPDGPIYLDGNSLGRLPVAAVDELAAAVRGEWGGELIRGWSHWIELGREVGDLLAGPVLDAEPGELVLSDSTSVNLYKLAAAALAARPDRHVVVVDEDNFPTDQYLLQSLAAERGLTLRPVTADLDNGLDTAQVVAALDDDVALVLLSHVAYRSGAIAELPAITAAAHRVGALVLWDLCHSVGSVPVPLRAAEVDLAVGCTYKYLNGGPGSPAFLYVRRELQSVLRQPITGWFGQADQFGMDSRYAPADGIDRFLVGTPPVLSAYGARAGARIAAEVGIEPVRAKGMALTSYAVELYDTWLAEHGCRLASPRDAARRGAHVTLHHPNAWQLCQAWQDAGVLPDFRTPDRLRIGFAPLYTRFADVYEAFHRLREILASGSYRSYPEQRSRVT
ncbi:kynureninase [Actinocatenispora thailandica]|uniref:Kynureninase n=1 Tax=Actinocatenispora thailandica TaxID=227318 RepID=A0A7R7DSD1_9ACTN|nr:kynureninase [Actinocatenispora thailandica]BCJ36770.1 kynureninase [Actinocatenispora thailandica]